MSARTRRPWWGLPILVALGLACQKDEEAPPIAEPPAVAVAPAMDPDSPRGLCLQGCERVERCGAEQAGDRGEELQRRVDGCRLRCRRLGPGDRKGMAQLRACLGEEACGGFQTCLASDGQAHVPRVEVASLAASGLDDRCERQCGLVGDCLQATEREDPRAAAALELSCLEVCLGNPPDSERGKQLDGCGARETCGELLSCTAEAWGPASSGSTSLPGPPVKGECEPACQRVVNCLIVQLPAGSGSSPADVSSLVSECTSTCEQLETSTRASDRESREDFFRCAERRTCEDLMSCFTSSF